MKGWGGWQQVEHLLKNFFSLIQFLKPESFPLFLSLSKMCV